VRPLGGVERVASPLRGMVQRFAFVLLIGAALTLLVLSKTGNLGIERMRSAIFEVATPVLEVLSQPAVAVNQAVDEVRELIFLRDENIRLREENERLRQWHTVAQNLEQENAVFRSQVSARNEPQSYFVSARVIGDAGGPFIRTALINAGVKDGLVTGLAAVTSRGLAGRVIEAGKRASRILLLTDLNSRVPVVIEGSRYRAVLEGDNSDTMHLNFLAAAAKLSPGDRVVTSGHGGVFPPGLPVGVVSSGKSGTLRVQPFVDYDRLEFVRVIRYAFPQPDEVRKGIKP
jgi:rod shape-determining protein MreC